MEPVKSLIPLGKWLLRLTVAVFVYTTYFDTFIGFSFKGFNYFIATAFVLLAVLLIIGGLLKRNTLTVLTAFAICVLSVVMMFLIEGKFELSHLYAFFTPAAIGFYFMARGNKG
jgi:hypothetical protein